MQQLYVLTALAFLAWFVYWRITEAQTNRKRPKQSPLFSWYRLFSKIFLLCLYTFIFVQLTGTQVLPIEHVPFWVRIVGFLLVIGGQILSGIGRIALHMNWTTAYDYQIKKGHELVTSGIYQYIRHPIYAGMVISLIGVELVVGSWLGISFLALFVPGYAQSRREEKLLLSHFGDTYKNYIKRTKMFIPFIF